MPSCGGKGLPSPGYIDERLHMLAFTPRRRGSRHQPAPGKPTRKDVIPCKPNPELLAANAPEATEAWFTQARPAYKALPSLFGPAVAKEILKPKRGRLAVGRETKAIMTIDTQIRHVTKSGANLFRELGFAHDEAERFQAESKQQIHH